MLCFCHWSSWVVSLSSKSQSNGQGRKYLFWVQTYPTFPFHFPFPYATGSRSQSHHLLVSLYVDDIMWVHQCKVIALVFKVGCIDTHALQLFLGQNRIGKKGTLISLHSFFSCIFCWLLERTSLHNLKIHRHPSICLFDHSHSITHCLTDCRTQCFPTFLCEPKLR